MNYTPKENRELVHGQLVGMHWNSHKNCYSIVGFKSRHSPKVVLGYVENATLYDVTFHIDKAKQKKVREMGKKDRHAFVVGYLENTELVHFDKELGYNPHQLDSFVDKKEYRETGTIAYLDKVEKVNLSTVGGKPYVTYE